VYISNGKVYSSVVGILLESDDYVSVIALNGPYYPQVGDGILGVIKTEIVNGYFLDYNFSNELYLPKSLIKKELKLGDVIFARIANISDNDSVDIDNINILPKGRLFFTSPVKVPRLIGKNDSMLNTLKKQTNANIVIGKNGWIWYNTKNDNLLERALNLIVNNSQKSNLTNSVKTFLEENKE
jgi:exosome complex component RRP4